MPQTPKLKRIIDRAIETAVTDQSTTVGTEYLLHGICGDNDAVAYWALNNCGLDMAELQAAVSEARQSIE